MEAIECTGLWWLPGKQNEQVAGTLTISESGNLHLSLIGTLGPNIPSRSKSFQIILGSVDKSPGGNSVTLVWCMLTGAMFGSFAGEREQYHATRGYFGAHLLDEGAFSFKFASIRVGGLTEWAHAFSGLSVESSPSSALGEKVPFASYTRHAPVNSEFPGGKATFDFGLRLSHKGEQLIVTEQAVLNILLETPRTADQLNSDYVYPVQNLMTFICDRAQKVDCFFVKPEPERGNPEQNPEIVVLGPRVEPEEEDEEQQKERVPRKHMLFTLKEIDFPTFFPKWMEVTDRYTEACSIFFALKYGPPAYIDMTFLGVVQSLHLYYSRTEEGMARRVEEETQFRQILSSLQPSEVSWLVGHLSDRPYPTFESELSALLSRHRAVMSPLISNREDRFVTEVINTLHYLVHREADADASSSHGADLYWLLEKLRVLFKASFLAELGISEQQALSWFERAPLYQHIRELEGGRESERAGAN